MVLDPLPENDPLAPLEGALNVIGTPAAAVTGQPLLFASATCRPVAKACSSTMVCGVPPVSVSAAGGLDAGQLAPPAPPRAPLSPPARGSPTAPPAHAPPAH